MPNNIVPSILHDESSSDDDAPEEISVATSRQQGISQIKNIHESLRRNKDEEKEKRRQRHEMFRIQKKNKLRDLSKRKLPDDVLAAVSAKATKKLPAQESNSEPPAKEESSHSDADSDHAESDGSDSGVEDDDDITSQDFIPLGKNSHLALVTPAALAVKTQTTVQQVFNFRHDRLYNQPTIPRESADKRKARFSKRKAILMT